MVQIGFYVPTKAARISGESGHTRFRITSKEIKVGEGGIMKSFRDFS